jgi:hypothetical protein
VNERIELKFNIFVLLLLPLLLLLMLMQLKVLNENSLALVRSVNKTSTIEFLTQTFLP